MPHDSSFKRSPSSNALDISSNTPQTSLVTLQSKKELISWTIDNNQKMQEWPGMKPDWIFFKRLLQQNWVNKSLYMNLSKILHRIGSKLIGLQSANFSVHVSCPPQFRIRKPDIFGVEKWSFGNWWHVVIKTRTDRFFHATFHNCSFSCYVISSLEYANHQWYY